LAEARGYEAMPLGAALWSLDRATVDWREASRMVGDRADTVIEHRAMGSFTLADVTMQVTTSITISTTSAGSWATGAARPSREPRAGSALWGDWVRAGSGGGGIRGVMVRRPRGALERASKSAEEGPRTPR
jgi:hypothetical protein